MYPCDGKRDWSESDKNDFSRLVTNRRGQITTSFQKHWPLFFCKLRLKLPPAETILSDHTSLTNVHDYLIYRKIAQDKKISSITTTFYDKIYNENLVYDLKRYSGNEKLTINPNRTHISGTFSTVSSSENKYKDQFNFKYNNEHSNLDLTQLASNYLFRIEDINKKYIQLDADAKFICKVAYLTSPFEFYVHCDFENHEQYLALELKMKEFYSTNEAKLARFAKSVKYDFIRTNGVCVAKTYQEDGGGYYRVQVKEIKKHLKADNNINVFCFDEGVFCDVNCADLFPITEEFMEYTQHCIFCKLDSVVPKENEWSKEAVKFFRDLINKDNKLYYARVTNQPANSIIECKLNDPLQVALFDVRSKTNDPQAQITINDALVEKEFAVYSLALTKEDPNNEVLESISVLNEKQHHNSAKETVAAAAVVGKSRTDLPGQENVQEFKTAWIQKYLDEQYEIKNQSIYFLLGFIWNLN